MKTASRSGFKQNPPKENREIVSDNATEAAFAETYGIVKSDGPLCIQRLLGKSCQAETAGERCECWPPGSEHRSLWEKDGKPFAFVFQPYELEQDQVQRLGEFCGRYGLQYSLQGRNSWYYPTRTFMVFITRLESRI